MVDRPAVPVVFVHGLWVTAASWRPFCEPWLRAGYEVHTPEWPVFAAGSASEFRNHPPASLGTLSIEAVVDAMAAYICKLDRPPLLVGHSFGGLFIQLLVDRGLGRAGIALNPAPIAGVVPGWLTLTAAAPAILRWQGWRRPYAMSKELWAERYANAAPRDQQAENWEQYVVPTAGRIIHQAAFWQGTRIDPHRRKAPLLITAGDQDRLVTPYLSRAAFRIQSRSSAPTDFIDFPGRSHLLIAEPGWEAVAQACIAWDAPHQALQSDAEFLKAPKEPFCDPSFQLS